MSPLTSSYTPATPTLRVCPWCRQEFGPVKGRAIYCSTSHAHQDWRRRTKNRKKGVDTR